MPDVTLVQSNSNNGTLTPSTSGSITPTAGNLLVCIIAVLGTSPTIALPTGGSGGWSTIRSTNGATLSFAMFKASNNGGGAYNPSSVLGGTVTGWVSAIFEFSATGSNTGLQGSAQLASAIAQLTNVFPSAGQTLPNELFVYAVARATATITPQNTSNSPLSVWSSSVQPQAGVQGLSMDFYWMSGLGQGVNQYPQASGLLSGAVASVAIGAWFNTIASNTTVGDNVGGAEGIYVPQFYQGMIGG